jgi:hypothetical protein
VRFGVHRVERRSTRLSKKRFGQRTQGETIQIRPTCRRPNRLNLSDWTEPGCGRSKNLSFPKAKIRFGLARRCCWPLLDALPQGAI